MAFSIERISSGLQFGARVRGLNSDNLSYESVREGLYETWINYGLIVFSDCEMSRDFHLSLSRVFGNLEVHKTKEYLDKDTPELVTLSATGDTELEVDGHLGEIFGWHRDLIYTPSINRGGILRSLKPSQRGGLTGFLDSAEAYDRLPLDLQAEVQSLRAVYQIGSHEEFPRATTTHVKLVKRSPELQSILGRRDKDFPKVSHPMVFTHPDSGRKVLNFSPFFFVGVEGLSTKESDNLLNVLSEHIFNCPSYHHQWTTDELLLWDNWRILHMVGFVPSGEERVMQRTTIAGDYGLGRLAGTQAGGV